MRRGLRAQCVCRLGVLALLLALFGHDALMASLAFAAPSPLSAMATHAGGGHVTTFGQGERADRQAPEHRSDCGTTGAAAPISGNQPEVAALATAGGIGVESLAASALDSGSFWSEPLWPPGTRRAFLQVYRI